MPVEQAPQRVTARSRDDAKIVKYHDFIDEKIDSTRRMVKVVDLATALVELFVAVLLYLLFAIVAEHWLVPGGLPAPVRVILFLVLAAGCGYFAYRRLWPLCVKAINPVYAAQAIEHGSPTLKNGLINLLLFRDKRAEISDAVYHTMEEQAAHGLTRVPHDATVDQTELIRLGYVLVGIVAVAGLYKVFSPKDPFVAAERVLMPWSNILPASRVSIADVKPGTEIVSQGEMVDVSADVRGLTDDDTVVVRYSTEDGQIVDRAIPLKLSADKMRYQTKLADGAEGALGNGISRNLKYHLEAGDARSLTYSLTVVPAATILIERVDYHYPKYTGLVDQSVDGVGDLRAIEGTKVTIHARANGAIREASVDFDADGRSDLQMAAEDAKAHVEFELGLRDDRQTPKHASYMLQFANAEGRRNHNPVKYSINVEPDRQPEVEIRQPLEKSRDARLDETVNVEIEARDPDFALSAVRLRGQVAGRDVLSEPLLKEEHRGPFTGRFAFVAAARDLKEGEVLEYWAEADDNRTPKPNTVATEHKTLRIVSANPARPPQDQLAKNDRQQPQNGRQSDKNQQQGENQKGQQGEQGKSGDQQSGGENGKSQQNQGGQGQKGQGQQGQGQQDQGQQGQGQKGQGQGDKQQGDKSQSGQSNGEQQSGGGDQNKQSSGLKQNQTGSGGGDKSNQHDGQGQSGESGGQSVSNDPSSKKPDQQGENKQTGAGAAGGESSKDGAQPDGARPDANKSEQENASGGKSNSGDQKNGEQQKGESQSGPQQKGQKGGERSGENQSGVSPEGDDDGEAFSRIQKRMEKSGEIKQGDNSKKDEGDKGQQGDSQGKNKENSSGGQKGQSQEDQPGAQGSESQQQSGANGKKSDSQQQPGGNSKPDEKAQGEKAQGEKGQGSQSRPDELNKQQKSDGESKQGQPSSGDESSTNGSAGSGNEEKKQGSPNSQPGTKPTQKTEQADSKGEKKDSPEPASGANGKKESDSHGDQGGDKTGRGSEGSGQKSPHGGTGSTGENQSADTGSGQSGEQGKGNTSSAGGKDAKSDHPTGSNDGKTQGQGSEQRDGAGNKAGGEKSNQQGASGGQSKQDQAGQNGDGKKQSQGDKSQGDQSQGGQQGQKPDGKSTGDKGADQQAAKNGEGQSGKSSDQKSVQQNGKDNGSGTSRGSGGSGEPGSAVNPQVSITGEAPEGDAANLEYAKKQTDLVVGKLADQLNRKRVDKDLLKDLGWSEADLKRFVDRWQQRKAAAEQTNEAGDTAKRELNDALRSLGLRPGELRQNAVQKDSMRDLHEGYRGPVPAEYKDRLRAYNQGVSKAHAEDK